MLNILLLIYFSISRVLSSQFEDQTQEMDEVRNELSSTSESYCIQISERRRLCGESVVNFCRDNMAASSCRDYYLRQGLDEIDLSERESIQQ